MRRPKKQRVAAITQSGAMRLSQITEEAILLILLLELHSAIAMLAQIKTSDNDVWNSLRNMAT